MPEYNAAVWDPHIIKHTNLLECSQSQVVKRHNDLKWVGPIKRSHEGIKSHPDVEISRRAYGITREDLGLLSAHSPTRRNHHWKRYIQYKNHRIVTFILCSDHSNLETPSCVWGRGCLCGVFQEAACSRVYGNHVLPYLHFTLSRRSAVYHIKLKMRERTGCSKAMLHSTFALFVFYAAPLAAWYWRWR